MAIRITGAAAICVGAAALWLAASAHAGDEFDCYFNYLEGRDWPDEHDTVYSEDVQGIAHDDAHWFITKQGADGTVLYKIHVSQDLTNPLGYTSTTPLGSGLSLLGFHEFKAMDSRLNPFDGLWYIVVAVQGSAGAGLAVYDANLQLKGAAVLAQQGASGWCAIDNDGRVYSAENATSHLNRYALDWAALAANGTVAVTFQNTVALGDENGFALTMDQYQGGDFTPEGDKLYIVTGFFGEPTGPHGIHVFDATVSGSFQRVAKSGQSGMFAFLFNPNCEAGDFTCEEPEGLTFWDLNAGQLPNVRGELHVLLLDNDQPDGDDVYLKHYSEGVWVQAGSPAPPNGDPLTPDRTVTDGVARALPSMEVKVRPGNYPESLTITKRLKLVNPVGATSAVIGQ